MTTSAEVPGRLPVAIDGHPYLADAQGFARETVQVIRQQADTSFEPGESSLNPQGLWRRSQESWIHGAGQIYLDGRKGLSAYSQISQDPERFRSSKGLDCWTQGQISLLHPTLKTWSTTNTNLYLAVTQVVGGTAFALYVADGNEVYWAAIPYGALGSLALQNGTGWTPTNATISASGNGFRLTSAAGGAVSVTSPTGTAGIPVDAGRQYAAYFQAAIGSGSGRFFTVSVRWYTAAGATISTTTPVTSPNNDNPGSAVTATVTAPATAGFAALILAWTTNFGAGEYHTVLAASLAPYDVVSTAGFADTWTSASINAGQAAQPVQSLATDGNYVWAALGTSGLHRTRAGQTALATADVPAAYGGGQVSLVGYANGFLLAAGSDSVATGQNVLWAVGDPLGSPSLGIPGGVPIKKHPNDAFVWTGTSPGRSCVYAFGNAGGNGEVYKILFDPNTGSLATAASPATYLPDGETIHALQFYAGGIIMGTGKGIRLGTADGAGNIDYGPLVPTSWPVRCLEPQDRYCWFGWTKYDATSSGLGRIDLGFFTDTLTPAWASDLMTNDTTSGDVVGAVTFAPYGYTANQRPPVRVFTVAGQGVYVEDPGSRVASGQFQTGTIRYSTSEPKTTRSIDLRHHALPAGATAVVEMQRDSSGTWEAIGTSSTTGAYGPAAPLDLLSETAEAMEFRFTLTRPTPAGTDYTRSPEMTRWTAKVLPVPSTIDETFTIPIEMRSEVLTNTGDGVPYHIDVPTEIAYLKTLEQNRTLITLQVGSLAFTNCFVLASQFQADTWGPGRAWLEGKYIVQISTARG